FFLYPIPHPPRTTLFPYTTLFRSLNLRTVTALRSAGQVTASLDEAVGDGATPLGELVADTTAVDASERTDRLETHQQVWRMLRADRKSTRLNSSHVEISYAVFCLK